MKPRSPQQALHRLAAFCSHRERCIHDIKQKLSQWEIPETGHSEIIRHLQREHFLDEVRFCHAFVNDKSKYNQWGVYKIKYELKKKQIPEELIREALATIHPEENKEQLLKLLRRKKETTKGKNALEINQKLIRFAAARGFSLNDIDEIIRLMSSSVSIPSIPPLP